jgi:hypothetical protein
MGFASLGITSIWAISFILSQATAARAQEPAYCQKVRARAASDAALLMSPRAILQGIRFPQNGQIDVGATAGNGYQIRAGLSFSPLDFYKGLSLLRAGDADCEQHESSTAVTTFLTSRDDAARLRALRAEVGYLHAHRDLWRAISAAAAERLSDRVITLAEFNDVRQQVDTLEHRLVQAEGEANQIDAKLVASEPRTSVIATADRYAEQSTRLEREIARARSLDAWQFRLTGGVVPQGSADWYGLAELSFNLGGIIRTRQDDRYVDARTDEIEHSREEIAGQVRQFRAQTAAALDQARRDLEIVERDLDVLERIRAIVAKSDAEHVAQARDTLAVESLSAESDAVFLRTLVQALAASLEDPHGP